MDVEKLLADWDTPRTFAELPFREDMKYCTVTMDDKVPEKGKGLDGLINAARRQVKSMSDKIRKSTDIER